MRYWARCTPPAFANPCPNTAEHKQVIENFELFRHMLNIEDEDEAALREAQGIVARLRRRELYKYVTDALIPQVPGDRGVCKCCRLCCWVAVAAAAAGAAALVVAAAAAAAAASASAAAVAVAAHHQRTPLRSRSASTGVH